VASVQKVPSDSRGWWPVTLVPPGVKSLRGYAEQLGYLVRGHVVNIEGHNSIVRHTLDYCLRLAR
jgi:hypothetical protein